jgi:uncharacterized protein YidB (DUF937 family)
MEAIAHSPRRVQGMDRAQLVNAIMHLLADQQSGGIEGLIDRFISVGLGDVINSWISPLENQPVSETQIRRVLGRDLLDEIAWQARMSRKEASFQVALFLPQVVDKLTPTGRVTPGRRWEKRMRRLKRVLVS